MYLKYFSSIKLLSITVTNATREAAVVYATSTAENFSVSVKGWACMWQRLENKDCMQNCCGKISGRTATWDNEYKMGGQ